MALNVPVIRHYEKYLGLPSFVGRNRLACFAQIKEWIWGGSYARLEGKVVVLSWSGGYD